MVDFSQYAEEEEEHSDDKIPSDCPEIEPLEEGVFRIPGKGAVGRLHYLPNLDTFAYIAHKRKNNQVIYKHEDSCALSTSLFDKIENRATTIAEDNGLDYDKDMPLFIMFIVTAKERNCVELHTLEDYRTAERFGGSKDDDPQTYILHKNARKKWQGVHNYVHLDPDGTYMFRSC